MATGTARPKAQPQAGWQSYLPFLLLAAIAGLAIFFRLYNLGGRDLWTDEAWVALAALKPTPGAALAAGQSTPPFYILSLWAATHLWDQSEVLLRSLSLIFGIGTLAVVWLLGRRLTSLPASLLALAAVAFSPVMVYYSKELKQYSGDAFFAVLVLFLAEWVRSLPAGRGWMVLALAGVVGLGFSHPLIFILPVAGAVVWFGRPSERRRPLVLLGVLWTSAFVAYYFLFFRYQTDPGLVAYWAQDFPDTTGLRAFLFWLGGALYRYFWYFLGEWGVFWGPPLLAVGLVVWWRQGSRRAVLYFGGPLLLAFTAACLHRYPFMAHYGGNRLMLFSAPLFYLAVAAGGCTAFAWLWHRRQGWLALALTGVLLVALHPLANFQENLYPVNNREEIQPLVTYLETHLRPRDSVYVYYFAVSPFKYYYRGVHKGICWGQSCVETGLEPTTATGSPPRRVWVIASHILDLKDLRRFAEKLLGPEWSESECLTRVGAVLLRFERRADLAAKNRGDLPTPTGSDSGGPPTGRVCE